METKEQGQGLMPEPSPEKMKQLETTKAAISHMLYAPETKQQVQQMISGAEPHVAIPKAASTIFMQFEDMSKKQAGNMDLGTKLACGVHAYEEVATLAQAMGVLPKEMGEEEHQPMLKATIQDYIQRGLKDGSIDPIELQQEVEPLLNDKEREIGGALGQEHNVSQAPSQQMMNESMYNEKSRGMQVENAGLKKQLNGMKGALQNMPQGGQDGV